MLKYFNGNSKKFFEKIRKNFEQKEKLNNFLNLLI